MTTPRLNITATRAALKARDWTQADLARAAGLGEAEVSRVFNGLKPSKRVTVALEKALGPNIWRNG